MSDNTDPDCPLCNPALQAELVKSQARAICQEVRIKELQAQRDWLKTEGELLSADNRDLGAENAKLREALGIVWVACPKGARDAVKYDYPEIADLAEAKP